MADCVFSPSLAGGAGSAAHLEGQLDGLGVEVEASSDHVVRGLHMGQLAAVQLPHQQRQTDRESERGREGGRERYTLVIIPSHTQGPAHLDELVHLAVEASSDVVWEPVGVLVQHALHIVTRETAKRPQVLVHLQGENPVISVHRVPRYMEKGRVLLTNTRT